MFSTIKFPTLRSKIAGKLTSSEAPVGSRPPKTPTLGSDRKKRCQRRRSEPGLLPTISGFKKDSAAQETDRLAPGDKICSINGISTARLTNDEVLSLLDNVEERASLEVEYCLPNYDSQNSLCITTRVTQVSVDKADGSLGMTLRGGELNRCGSDDSSRSCGLIGMRSSGPLLVTHVRPGGPAHLTARIKPGDRLLKVDNISLANKTLSEAYQILQNSPSVTNLTIEYDVSVMDSVKFATGPLLVEIERGCNESLGIILTDKCYDECYSMSSSSQYMDGPTGIFIEKIIPASISDRCGALHPGDQLLAVNDLTLENLSYTPDEVMNYLENYIGKGFTQLQIYPVHMLLKSYATCKSRGKQPESPMSGMSTLNSRKSQRHNRQLRQSSLPKMFEIDSEFIHNNFITGVGVCRSEILSMQIDIPPNHDSGITVCEDRELLLVSHITHQSPAYRTGCIQLGDRILSINSHQSLTAQAVNEILQKRNDSNIMRYLNVKIEFNMADNIEASSGVFNVKLARNGAGLGVTITGNKQHMNNSEEPMTISNIKVGSVAYRNGTLAVGDQLLAIDSQPLNNLSLEAAFNILQNFPDDIITLTIKKVDKSNNWDDISGMTLTPNHYKKTPTFNNSSKSNSFNIPTVQTRNFCNSNNQYDVNRKSDDYYILDLELIKQNNETLGLTIAGSEDASQPIVISGLVKGSLAERSGSIQVGDHILYINEENVQQKPLSEAIKILQSSQHKIFLKLLRSVKNNIPSSVRENEANMEQGPSTRSVESPAEPWNNKSNNSDSNYINSETGNKKQTGQIAESISVDNRISYLPTDENKLLASGYKVMDSMSNDLPMPNYNFTNTLRTFKTNAILNTNLFSDPDNTKYDECPEMSGNNSETNMFCTKNSFNVKPTSYEMNSNSLHSNKMAAQTDSSYPKSNTQFEDEANHNMNALEIGIRKQYNPQKNCLNLDAYQQQSSSYQTDMTQNYDTDLLGFYNVEPSSPKGTIHHVTLYKDVIYDDYGFSVSDGLYERGVYINRIRKGGPADIVGLLRPYDRILQVNGTRTVDFDCCLTVPLIASAGDRIELVLQRLKDTSSWSEDNNSNILEGGSIITKTI